MKKLIILLALVITLITNAQAPQGFNYQATVRNSTGAVIANQNVYFKFNVMLNSATSVPVFSETHYVPTDDLGQVNLVIGTGTATTGSFSTINWASGSHYLGIELNTGAGYVAMGTTQLLSVPYALYANSAGNAQVVTPNLASVLAENNGANNLQIKNLADPTDAQDAVTKSFSEVQISQLQSIDAQLQSQISALQAQITALQNAIVTQLPNVTIGTQIWSTSNLDVTTYRDGTPIPQVTDPSQWGNLTTGAWCYYNNDATNGSTYAKIYNWYAVAGIHDNDPNTPNKSLAPSGWHVPSDTEWNSIINFLDSNANGGLTVPNVAGSAMKEIGITHWFSPNTGATNSSGFSGLPGGYRFVDGSYAGLGINGYWWSSSENGVGGAWYRNLNFESTNATKIGQTKNLGYSVRCVKD
jgi:uncharacterized protein (TIGR02145 family)